MPTPAPLPRRRFLSSSVKIGSAGVAAAAAATPAFAHVAADETVRVGLVGCGGRGTGAAAQALRAEPNAKLVAVADAFADKTDRCLKGLATTDVAGRVAVTPDTTFVGLDAYEKLLAAGVDVALLATPTYFRPVQLEACVAAGVHTFFEKPVAVDAPGIRRVLAAVKEAKANNIALLGGLCWRYETNMVELIDRLQDGAIGELVALQSHRFSGYARPLPRRAEWGDAEWKLRNWYNINWLSGDFVVEQFVHELDKLCWLKDQYPASCIATGGRQSREGAKEGNIFDHFSAAFTFPDGVKYFAATRQQPGTAGDFVDLAYGTSGRCDMMKYQVTRGGETERLARRRTDMHQLEHDAFFAALRRGETPNDVEYMAYSTLTGLLAREAAYTGREITWEQMLSSDKQYGPAEVTSLDQNLPVPPTPVPGVTAFA